MKTLFHVLAHSCPMLEYQTSYELFVCFKGFKQFDHA